jgi:hypothetical protein
MNWCRRETRRFPDDDYLFWWWITEPRTTTKRVKESRGSRPTKRKVVWLLSVKDDPFVTLVAHLVPLLNFLVLCLLSFHSTWRLTLPLSLLIPRHQPRRERRNFLSLYDVITRLTELRLQFQRVTKTTFDFDISFLAFHASQVSEVFSRWQESVGSSCYAHTKTWIIKRLFDSLCTALELSRVIQVQDWHQEIIEDCGWSTRS